MPEPYRVAVFGSTKRGNYGHGVDTAWSRIESTKVVAVADPDEAGRRAAAKRLGVERTFADVESMLDATKPDILSVCPRWIDQHHAAILAAVRRGVHVYTEKPFVRTLAEAGEIVDACERTHTKVGIAHPTRYSPRLDTVRRLIADGSLGDVLEFRGRGKEDRRGGCEDLWVLGSHVFDMVLALAGRPTWCFARLTKDGRPVTASDVFEGNEGLGPMAGNGVDAQFGLADGSTFYFASHVDRAGNPTRYGLRVLGSKGELELLEGVLPSVQFLGDSSWSPGRTGASWKPVSSAGIDQPEPLEGSRYTARHTLAIENLLSTIGTDREPKCSAHVGRDIVEMTMAVFESHRVGGPVTLPLELRDHPLTRLAETR